MKNQKKLLLSKSFDCSFLENMLFLGFEFKILEKSGDDFGGTLSDNSFSDDTFSFFSYSLTIPNFGNNKYILPLKITKNLS